MRVAAIALVIATTATARADEDYGKGSVIFARGQGLFRVDPRGRNEQPVATFQAKGPVRALRTDAGGRVLLADIGGTWGWMPLDGSTQSLLSLPCGAGPAELADDGSAVACKSDRPGAATMVVVLAVKRAFYVDVPLAGARPLDANRLIYADKTGIYVAPFREPSRRQRVAPEAPLRAFLPSRDGKRAVGVYAGEVYANVRTKKPAEVLYGLQLDGQGARRRAIKDATPIEWSHDHGWILVQEGASACLMGASGGEYKCWPGFTAMSTSPDGKWTLVLGNRDGSGTTPAKPPAKPPKKGAPKAAPKAAPKPPPPPPPDEPDGADTADGGEDGPPPPETAVALPTGPQSLYRARLEGMFTEKPVAIVKLLDGAAVWVPPTP